MTFWNRHSKDVRTEITKKQTRKKDTAVTEVGQVNVAFECNENNLNTTRGKNGAPVQIVTQEPLKQYKNFDVAEEGKYC